MLLQLSVENYGRFADKVVLSLLAVPGEAHPDGQVVDVPGVGPVLRTLVLYGPNGAGKSHLVDAFAQVCRLATLGVLPGSSIPMRPHKLAPGWQARPTTFELEVAVGGARWSYGLSVTSKRVEAEWLLRDEGTVFEREATDGARPSIEIGTGLPLDDQRRAFYGFVAEGTRDEQPFLAELRARSATELKALTTWLLVSPVVTTAPSWSAEDTIRLLLAHPRITEPCAYLLRGLGTGVTALRLAADSAEVQRRIDSGAVFTDEAARALAVEGVRLVFLHRGASGAEIPLALHELSDGTRRLLDLGLATMDGSANHTCFIDEIDRSLHSALAVRLVALLNANEARAQLVLTTHDTNLLDAGVFGRDAIWFVDLDDDGAAHLYSLTEFDRGQLDALSGHLERGYLQGRFGAIPFAGPARLRWSIG